MQEQKETVFFWILNRFRCQLEKDGLRIDDGKVIEFPNIVCIDWIFAFSYYVASLVLVWIETASFWTLILNSFVLARAICKTSWKNRCYTKEINKVAEKDHLNSQTQFFLKHCCKAYLHTQYREIFCSILIIVSAVVILGLKDAWIAPMVKSAACIALVGAAWDDFLSETENLYDAYPPIPAFSEK